jgi:hypothetical protein
MLDTDSRPAGEPRATLSLAAGVVAAARS